MDSFEPDGKFIYFAEDENLQQIAEHARPDIVRIPYNAYEGSVPMQVFGRHNMQNLQAACLACRQIGVSEDDFYRVISTFTGASNRLEKICETADCVAYKDFAHSPSKLKATVNAVRTRYPGKRLVACMELHTFSSLMADFLPQYRGCMAEADVAYVYFNPEVIAHKRLRPVTSADVRNAFGTENVEVFTDSRALEQALRTLLRPSAEQPPRDTALLMMTSGTFGGLDIPALAKELLQK